MAVLNCGGRSSVTVPFRARTRSASLVTIPTPARMTSVPEDHAGILPSLVTMGCGATERKPVIRRAVASQALRPYVAIISVVPMIRATSRLIPVRTQMHAFKVCAPPMVVSVSSQQAGMIVRAVVGGGIPAAVTII